MIRYRKIQFHNHPILGELCLDFCNKFGQPYNTIIFAGENGTGKSSIIEELYCIADNHIQCEMELEYEENGAIYFLKSYYKITEGSQHRKFAMSDSRNGVDNEVYNQGIPIPFGARDDSECAFCGIFSDVDISFKTKKITSATNMSLDSDSYNFRTTTESSNKIKQLIIDLQAMDDATIAQAVRSNPDKTINQLQIDLRMRRFTQSFDGFFKNLKYYGVKTTEREKVVLFQKYGKEIRLEGLSSGEKQIVFRGCFLLQNKNVLEHALVFIDEPETSLHPSWQERILKFYKDMFIDGEGIQTSQIFIVTHSPFVVQNRDFVNDKVIVLQRDKDGKIVVMDKPTYYSCGTMEAVQDAFSIDQQMLANPIVFVEGRTDERYYKEAISVFELDVPFQIRWIGHLDEKGQEVNTGKDALNKAAQFLLGLDTKNKTVLLYDCDTNSGHVDTDCVKGFCAPVYQNSKGIKIGIENALVLDSIDIEKYRHYKETIDSYGMKKSIPEFKKMDLCNDICSLDNKMKKTILIHLRDILTQTILPFFTC